MSEQILNKNAPYRLPGVISKDDVVLNLTDGTVTLKIRSPMGVETELAAVIDDAVAGEIYCDIENGILNELGKWSFSWHVIVGNLDTQTDPVKKTVQRAP